jgi:type II secretory pathway component GspD/PulD (secretin)
MEDGRQDKKWCHSREACPREGGERESRTSESKMADNKLKIRFSLTVITFICMMLLTDFMDSRFRGNDTSENFRGNDTSENFRGNDTSENFRGNDTCGFFSSGITEVYAQDEVEEANEDEAVKIDEEGIKEEAEGLYSFDLKNVDVREFLKILSVKSGVPIMPTKDVSGRITLFINNVTFQDVFDIMLFTQDLAYEKEDNRINVMPATMYEQLYGTKFHEKRKVKSFQLKYAKPDNVSTVLKELKSEIGKVIVESSTGTLLVIDTPDKLKIMEEAINELDNPLETLVFDLDYATTANLKEYMSDFITPDVGKIVVDERTNKMVVSDLAERIEVIKRLVSAFDEGSRQVAIAVRIIEVTLSDRTQRGIDWSRLRHFSLEGEFPVSLSQFQRLGVGALEDDHFVAVMDFVRTQGDTRILSQPQIVAINNEEASILLGTRQAYVSQSQSQAEATTITSETVEYIDVGVKLNVTPTINKEGFVTMKIKPEVSSIKSTLITSVGSTIPIIDTSELETVVKVEDGQTIMIAGLVKDTLTDSTSGTPGLWNIPILGLLFSNRDHIEQQTVEFIVFITPRIISGSSQDIGTAKVITEGLDIPAQAKGKKADVKETELAENKKSDVATDLWRRMKGFRE